MKTKLTLAVILLIFSLTLSCWASDDSRQKGVTAIQAASENAYIDRITGHRYFKTNDGTYKEFNKKGEFFRIVPADLPHLTNQTYVYPIVKGCYLLYTRTEDNCKKQIALPADKTHPKGWKLEQALVSLK